MARIGNPPDSCHSCYSWLDLLVFSFSDGSDLNTVGRVKNAVRHQLDGSEELSSSQMPLTNEKKKGREFRDLSLAPPGVPHTVTAFIRPQVDGPLRAVQ